MGLEMYYQAIPEDSGLLELARDDVTSGGCLCLVRGWFRYEDNGVAPGREREGDHRLWNLCCELAGRYPDLRFRNAYLDRCWDKLHYLLSATRRGGPATPADRVIDRAFGSGELIADHAQAVQGEPVRYLSPAAVREIARLLESMDRNALTVHYRPARMEAAGVYKFQADRAGDVEWRWIVESFEELRRFFMATAEVGYGVIVCLD